MPLDSTPGVVQTLSRQQVHDNFTRDYGNRVPAADVGPGTQPDVDASLAADTVAPLYSDAVTIGRGTTLSTSAGSWLATIGQDEGVVARPAVGATGFLSITTSAGGTNLQQGAVVLSKLAQKRYQVATGGLYTTATPVPIAGVDTGPSTNLAPGTAMQFQAPPPGCAPDCAVLADSEGNGLTGGRNADNDATLRQLISEQRANPPASGNDAEYQSTIKKTPGLSVQQVFTYPATLGPGTIAYVFTLNPAAPGQSRIPNAAQIAATLAWVTGQMPGDDGIFACPLVASPVAMGFQMVWGAGANDWEDASPWPSFIPGDPVLVAASPAPTLTSFRLTTTSTVISNPQPGQNIGFWNPVTGLFEQIQILTVSTVTAGRTWDITPDQSYGASAPYVPIPGQAASPWSDSLNSVVPAVVSYFDGLGPGEQVLSLPDPGLRQRRQPQSPQRWTSLIDARIVVPIYALGNVVETVTPLAPKLPFQTPPGAAATLSYLATLGDLAFYSP
jgi:uncharacterized phage protein gp47/JayE